MPRRATLLVVLALVLPCGLKAQGGREPYRDPALPVDARVQDLLGRMTPEEKFWQLYMSPVFGLPGDTATDYSHGAFGLQVFGVTTPRTADAARAYAERVDAFQRYFAEHSRLGIPIIPFDEAVHGLMEAGATDFPAAISLAATWDTALVARVAGAIAVEARSRGVRQVLSPVINVATDVRWGRVEETYGEDPLLVSRMGAAYVGAFERAGVVATPKHFVANVGAGGRDSYPIEVGERELQRVYFPPFEAALAAGARSVMTAYNSVDGEPATQNRHLLTDVLKGAWGFRGFVISDAAATGGAAVLHMTEPTTESAAAHALRAGLDVIFQSSYRQHTPYLQAFLSGAIPGAIVDSAVARVLRVKFALGLFEHPYVSPDSAAMLNGTSEHRALALDAAREGIVLLRNERGTLPLARPVGATLAVIGTDAVEARTGGYSGPGVHRVSILDAIEAREGAGSVRYAPGPGRGGDDHAVVPAGALSLAGGGRIVPGLQAEYFSDPSLAGTPVARRMDATVDFNWTFTPPVPQLSREWFGARWTGSITAPAEGIRRLGVSADDGYRLYLDGRPLLDRWAKVSGGVRMADVSLAPGSRHDIRLEYQVSRGDGKIQLLWDTTRAGAWQAAIDSAVRVARGSSAAVIVAGIEEGEFRDRARLGLPGHQEELIRAVAATGVPVTVVLVGGSAITMSRWIDQVGAVVDAWYPGEAGGTAVADVLFGDVDPAGRLPVTFPQEEGQLPLVYDHEPTGRGDDYVDLSGQPLFPFGFGLSYTTFAYRDLRIEPASIAAGGAAQVRCTVTNTGGRAGDEVVQLYLRPDVSSAAQPVIRLAGFQRIHLERGASRDVTFTLGPAELRVLDAEAHWVMEQGNVAVMIGASSRDIRLRGEVVVR